MFSLEWPTGGAVVELRDRWLPADQREVDAVVLGMALGAPLAGAAGWDQADVQPAIARQSSSDFSVTLQTPELGSRSNLMTTRAVRCPIQEGVGF